MELPDVDGDLGAPIFFLSCAHPPEHDVRGSGLPEPGQLFGDLCRHVGQLIGSPAGGESGFMDRSMADGKLWKDEVLSAAGTCQVFVALLSTPYLKSEWCAREWDAFSRRRVRKRGGGTVRSSTAILPVTWSPLLPPGFIVPDKVSRVQRFSPREPSAPEIERDYDKEGFYGLLSMSDVPAYKGAYQAATWRLAQAIVDMYHAYQVEPQTPDFDQLLNHFGGDDE